MGNAARSFHPTLCLCHKLIRKKTLDVRLRDKNRRAYFKILNQAYQAFGRDYIYQKYFRHMDETTNDASVSPSDAATNDGASASSTDATLRRIKNQDKEPNRKRDEDTEPYAAQERVCDIYVMHCGTVVIVMRILICFVYHAQCNAISHNIRTYKHTYVHPTPPSHAWMHTRISISYLSRTQAYPCTTISGYYVLHARPP